MIRRQAAIVGLAAGAAALIAVPAAFAAAGTTYTIKAGSHSSGSASYKASTSKIKFRDVDTKTDLGCKGGTASGKLTLGKKVAGSKAGTISGTTWKSCSGPGGLTLDPKQSGTWKLSASGKTSKGVTKVTVSDVKAFVSADPTPSLCKFTVTGTASGTYDNDSGVLAVDSAKSGKQVLSVSHVHGCVNQIKNGDTVTFDAKYKVKASDGKVSIKSN